MAEWHTYEIIGVQTFLGVVGAAVREAVLYDPAKPLSPWKIYASLITGGVLAPTSAGLLAQWLITSQHLEMLNAVMLAMAVSFWVGLMGIGLVMQVLNGNINPLAFLQSGEKK